MSRVIPEFFDLLHFTESNLGKALVSGDMLLIPVNGLQALRGHPCADATGPLIGTLVFKGVASSRRKVIEYIGEPPLYEPGRFKEPYVVEDTTAATTAEGLREYTFEGLQLEPRAWVESWVVHARSFELIVD